MFLVGHKPSYREKRIREFLQSEPEIAVLLAAVHFEWTLCRAILFLSKTPNVVLRDKMASYYGLDKYKDLWRDEVVASVGGERLTQVVQNWSSLREGFSMRNQLVHGRDNCTRNMATPKVEAMLQAASDIERYCASKGADLYSRMPVRRRLSDAPQPRGGVPSNPG